MEFTGLGVEMAQLAGRFGSVDPACADRRTLEWSLGAGRRLRAMTDAHEAAVTFHLESMIGRPDPDGHDEGPTAGQAGASDPDGASGGSGDAPGADLGGGAGEGSAGDPDAAGPSEAKASGGGHRETAEEYRLRLRRSKWLRRLSLFAAALEAGQITTAHVEALAAVFDHVEPTVIAEVIADEAALVEVARTVTRASFARYLRLRVDRVRGDGGAARLERQIAESFGSLGVDDDLGLHRLFVRLDPLRGEQVYTAIRHRVEVLQQSGAVEGMRRGQVIAQAVTDLICGTATTTTTTGGVEVLVVVDLLTLLQGSHDESVCETGDGLAIPVDVVRDLCHQPGATITAAVRDPAGVTVAVGRQTTEPPEPTDPPEPSGPGRTPTGPATAPSRPAGTSEPAARPSGTDHPTTTATDPTHDPAHGTATSHDPQPTSDDPAGPTEPAGSRGGPGAPPEPDLDRSMHDLAAMVAAAIAAASGDQLDNGRGLRLANRQQRRALRAMYRSCAHPDCRVPFADCEVHHVTPWEHDGPTNLANLLPVCGIHHHQVHEGRWRLTIDRHRTLTWHRPDGRLDARTPFQPLGATPNAERTAGHPADGAAEAEADERNSSPPTRPDTAASDPATSNAFTRSRNARGSPPHAPTLPDDTAPRQPHDNHELRLFDPTAA